ncbi:hypothetical protein GCM10008949_39460 [Deinococcus humi]|nr:hypothetical protein GCM10008949_39460 [Deinococcus humi]
MQGQKFLRSPRVFEADLASFLWPGVSMGLEGQLVATGPRDDPNMLHRVEHGRDSNGRSVTPELIRMDHVWHVVHQQPAEESLRRPCIAPSLSEETQHCTRIVSGSPQPEFFASDLNADFV